MMRDGRVNSTSRCIRQNSDILKVEANEWEVRTASVPVSPKNKQARLTSYNPDLPYVPNTVRFVNQHLYTTNYDSCRDDSRLAG